MAASVIKHLDLADLPVHKKDVLCKMLDRKDEWEDLARFMQFSEFDIENIKTESLRLRRSPTDLLINKWTIYGHNVTELFKLLADMQHFVAMHEIKDLVDKRYHIWLKAVPATLANSSKRINAPAVGQSQIFNARDPKKEDCPKEDLKENLKDLLNIPEVSIKDLEDATNKWAQENILGKGGFGVVYKGELLATKVAIKKLEYRGSRSGSPKDHLVQSLNELRHLNHCRHDNILPIYGYALKDETCFVVYQLMPGGSLEDRLSKRTGGYAPLTWPHRWNIAKGTARGLQYLHRYSAKPLIHGDIKPANILLDACCEPKIGDFGLSREGHVNDECQAVSRVFGTKPYLPQEFIVHSLFSTKVDVFSFGVVLFEIATGLKSIDKTRSKNPFLYDYMARVNESSMNKIAEVIDPTTPNDEACFNLCQLMIYLGKKCTDCNPNFRPEMMSVLKSLETFVPYITMNVAGKQ